MQKRLFFVSLAVALKAIKNVPQTVVLEHFKTLFSAGFSRSKKSKMYRFYPLLGLFFLKSKPFETPFKSPRQGRERGAFSFFACGHERNIENWKDVQNSFIAYLAVKLLLLGKITQENDGFFLFLFFFGEVRCTLVKCHCAQ